MIRAAIMAAIALIVPASARADQASVGEPLVCDGAIIDGARENRRIPVRVRIPAGSGTHPVILFSHGLGGSVDAGTIWATAWVDAGFAVVHVQHPGSDASLWQGLRGAQAQAALRKGMGADQFLARIADVRIVLDRIGSTAGVGACAFGRLDADQIGIAGHSFGARTVQALAGQQFRTPSGLVGMADPRIKAAIAFSPAPPTREPDETAFGKITIPFLSITGTRDMVPQVSPVTPADRIRPFRAMPEGEKFLLVVDGADHMVFSGGEERRRATADDNRTGQLVEEATVSFWKAFLTSGGQTPHIPAPPSLGEKDIWQSR